MHFWGEISNEVKRKQQIVKDICIKFQKRVINRTMTQLFPSCVVGSICSPALTSFLRIQSNPD